ncbi:MAG: site-2 protease family protein [Sedimentisphaerales bacterium]|nr:site-2 protease family protein [Sedimentisphaerales bacterium]
MSKATIFSGRYFRMFLMAVVIVPVVLLIARNIGFVGNALLVLLGFGAVVIVHEFGHFIVAKLSGIKVEAFSLFMPPILLGVQKTEEGVKIRILPEILPKKDDESGDGALCFTVASKCKPSETEYRVGLIPFGGFVKMLGQDDTGPVKTSDDPRSYANKPPHIRAAVLAAGVTFNVISAAIVFMIVFLVGINLKPAVVGGVMPDSPAERAGLKAGDEIIEINGESEDLDFGNIAIAAALSGRNEEVHMKVRHEDGTEKDVTLLAEQIPGESLRGFGIGQAETLTIAELTKDDAELLYEKTGLRPGDRITSVNGRQVQTKWQMDEIVENALVPEVTILAERTGKDKKVTMVEAKIKLEMVPTGDGQICSMVPRFRMDNLTVKKPPVGKPFLESGDVILKVGEAACPTYQEFRGTVKDYENKELPIEVLRSDPNGIEKQVDISVIPKRGKGDEDARIGIAFNKVFDAEHPVVAGTIAVEGGPAKLKIPRGASITAVDGVPVSNFYDVIREIRKYSNERITINYRLNEQVAGDDFLEVDKSEDLFAVKTILAEFIPFEALERTYKAAGPVDAVIMGYKKTVMFIAQTYVTLKRLLGGLVSPKDLMGPVGIITLSYRIVADQPLVYYVYFLGLISSAIAVFNFLPLPPLDGGLVVLLVVEKIKGSALSERVQAIIAYTGWTLIGTLILYVTFNDIVRNFFS